MGDLVASHESYRDLIWNLFSVPHRINFQWYQRPIKKFITSLKLKTWKMQWFFLTSKIRETMENADFSKHVKNVCKSITLKLQFDFVRFVLRGMNRSGNIFTRLESVADFSETRKCY